jgi:hypothetical protein
VAMRRTLLVLVVVLVVGCGSDDGGSKSAATTTDPQLHAITGSFVLIGTNGEDFDSASEAGCWGTDGYQDIEDGAQVTVTNEAGTVIGNSALKDSEVISEGCRFYFQVLNVPRAKFYGIEVVRRGKVNFSHEELEAKSWNVELTLG